MCRVFFVVLLRVTPIRKMSDPNKQLPPSVDDDSDWTPPSEAEMKSKKKMTTARDP